MKAKELAKLLMKTPEAEVVIYEYVGCDTPLLSIKNVELFNKGQVVKDTDSSQCLEKTSKAKYDIIILKTT